MVPFFSLASWSVSKEVWIFEINLLYVVSVRVVCIRTSHEHAETASRNNSTFVGSLRWYKGTLFAFESMCSFSFSSGSVQDIDLYQTCWIFGCGGKNIL